MDKDHYSLYKKKQNQIITAVQLDLDTSGFTFHKWGGEQQCRAGDWLVNSDDDCYTVTNLSFQKTYTRVSPGRYLKHATVKAKQALTAGSVKTQEGQTSYQAGDYIVKNTEDESDSYAVAKDPFNRLYELVNK